MGPVKQTHATKNLSPNVNQKTGTVQFYVNCKN